ncbi:MAG: undecaprenyldiphospho-muramoylpentapeptide beta-N-acetylglucosaminyltransferase [Clostridia bacterium]
MNVIFACAGSGGHVNPAIAIAGIMLKHYENLNILFIGTKNGIENDLVKKSGFNMQHIRTGKLIRSFTFKNLKAITHTYLGIKDAKKIMLEFKPDLVIGTGGYICGPVMIAAKKYKIPYILHESNAFPGLAVKMLAKNASSVMVGFSEAKSRLKVKGNIVYTGTPAKFNLQDMQKLDKQKCKISLGLGNINKKIILVMCGSQGAKKINDTVLEMLKSEPNNKVYIILATGNNNYDIVLKKKQDIQKQVKYNLDDFIKLEKYIYDMDKMYKVADLCITRAGAMSVTELEIASKGAILIPLPSAAENHQYYNAKIMEDAGAGIILEEKDLTANSLKNIIDRLIEEDELEKMGEKANKLVKKNVEEKIYKCIKDTVKK